MPFEKGFEESKNVRPKWPVPERDARESFCEWLGGEGAGRDDERLAEPFRVRHFSLGPNNKSNLKRHSKVC